jgi:signal transduction histidine kinase
MMLEHALRLIAPESEELQGVVSSAKTHASEALEESRQAIHALWNSKPTAENPGDYVRKLLEAFQSTDIGIEADFHGLSPNLSEKTKWVMYRTVQEAITNAVKHGNASQIRISAWQHKRTMTVTVYSSGNESPLAWKMKHRSQHSPGRGLSSLGELLSDSGGRLVAGATEQGFQLTAYMPIDMGDSDG